MSDIAKNLNKLIKEDGITPSELSRITGVDRSVLHKILTGATKNPSIDSIKAIIQYYGFNEVVLGVSNLQSTKGIPIISWSEALVFPSIDLDSKQRKYIKLGLQSSDYFCLIPECTIDSRFSQDTLLIVDYNKKPKNLSYIIIKKENNKIASLKRFILDGETPYLKSIDSSIPSVKYNPKIFKIIGVVVQSILNYEESFY